MSLNLEKIAFKPVNVLLGVAAGAIAGMLFKQAWRLAAGEGDAPDAGDEDRRWGEILAAAALEGAIFAVTKAVVHRSGAIGVRKMTGVWPD